MRKTEQWNYEESVPVQDAYREDEPCAEEDVAEMEGYGGYEEDLERYMNDLNGYMDEGCSQEERERIEGIQDTAFLLNSTDRFVKDKDPAVTRERFRQYVKDVNSGDPEAMQAAQEGACMDLEFYIVNIINRKFSTYIEKDRSFFEDLMQAGRVGIIAALPKYDPDKGMPTTYFTIHIKHEITSQVNLMKHDTKSHMATTKKKIMEINRQFAKYGKVPSLHDYMYGISHCPFHRIVNALAEIEAGNTKTSIDDPDVAPLMDHRSAMRGPEDTAISGVNYGQMLEIIQELEPREEIVQCFIEMYENEFKTAELSERYGLPASEITDGISRLKNLLRCHPKMRRLYPERFRSKEHEFFEQIAYMPVEEGSMAMESVLESLRGFSEGGEPLELSMG